ncbi:MAG: hypothetical protein ACI9OJ_003118 [Myxococcota bacterium]|jgi:uncharacterized protein YqeY
MTTQTTDIALELNGRLKQAMKDRNQPALDVIRAIRTKIGEIKTSKGFSGTVDNALYLETIAKYVKSMTKAREEYIKAGERGVDLAAALTFEIDYLSEFLPKKLGEAETKALVEAAIEQSGASSKKEIGRVMGMVLKGNKELVDAGLVRRLADALLD